VISASFDYIRNRHQPGEPFIRLARLLLLLDTRADARGLNGRDVAQISKPAVSPTSKSARRSKFKRVPSVAASAGWKLCDTAGLETCATTLSTALDSERAAPSSSPSGVSVG
jgi:hypothetical protein